jgi:diguanylate cyclase (GGDEF)-like protein
VNYLQEHAQSVRQERELKAANAVLEQLSFIDPLTGIANRRQFNESLEAEWKRGVRRQEWVGVLMIDVDCFKGVNDIHGHAYGDECLFTIGQTLHNTMMRATDLVARYGGEEFIVLLGDTDLSHAVMVAERLQGAVNKLEIINEASPFGRRLTVSVGVAAMQPNLLTTGASLLEQADQALYIAKRRGRNRIQEYEYSFA